MKTFKNLKISIAALSVAAWLSLSVNTQAGGLLKIPEADWTGGLVTCILLQQILEDEMGYKVKRIGMPSGAQVMAAIRSGDLDFGCENWPSYNATNAEYVTEYGGDGSIVNLGNVGVVGNSGYFVPRYLVEGASAKAPGLKSYKDLNTYKGLFKTLESGNQGRIIGCPTAAWECKEAERIAGLGLDYIFTELGSETAHWAEMEAAYKRKEPFIAYAWAPHWIHAKLDLVEIELPAHSEQAWPVSDWPNDVTFNYGNPASMQKNADVAALIGNMNLSNGEQAKMILAVDVDKRKIDDVVAEWKKANQKIWRPWVPTS